MLDTFFPVLHNDDLGSEPIGYIRRGSSKPIDSTVAAVFQAITKTKIEQGGLIDGLPVRVWYPKAAQEREDRYRRQIIEENRAAEARREGDV